MIAFDDVLARVRQRIIRYRDQAIGEQNTKDTLIFPIEPTTPPAVPVVPLPPPAGETDEQPAPPHGEGTPWRAVTLQDLITAGLLTPPVELERVYKGQRLSARITAEGAVIWDERAYDSVSTAAGMARRSVIGTPPGRKYPQTNGWTFWQLRDADGQTQVLDVLRQRHYSERQPDRH
jgi:hypothetical protein